MGDDPSPEAGRGSTLPNVVDKAKAANSTTARSASYSNRRAQFRAVYDANYRRVLGYVLRRTATRQDAEDVVAETFLTAWRRLEDVPRGSGARPWLYGVARNALANHRRGERRRERLTGSLRAESVLPSYLAEASGDVAWAAAAFARLRDDDREVLALAAWEGLDPGEMATVLGCSRNAARIRVHRARRRLARELQGNDVEGVGSIPAVGTGARSLISLESERGQ